MTEQSVTWVVSASFAAGRPFEVGRFNDEQEARTAAHNLEGHRSVQGFAAVTTVERVDG